MIPVLLRTTLAVGVIIYFLLILFFLKKKALELKYTLLWMAAGCFMLLLVIFPALLPWIVDALGFESNMNGLFVIVLAFLIMLMVALTSIVSRQMRKINKLVQHQAILENEILMLRQAYIQKEIEVKEYAVREKENDIGEERK